DVKTRNVMRVEGGRIVLMDFGSVTHQGPLDASESDAFLSGTPLSMAPEQWTGGAIGPAADLYSLGVLLYRLVSLRSPVEATSLDELIRFHGGGGGAPLRDRRPDLPADFIAIVEKSLVH